MFDNKSRWAVLVLVAIGAVLGVCSPRALAAPPTPLNVNLNEIGGLGNVTFGPAMTSFASFGVSTNGTVAYFTVADSGDLQMRNLMVATLTTTGAVTGIPQCYVTSAWPFQSSPSGYPGTAFAASVTLLLNPAKHKLYSGDNRGPASTCGLNVYSLGSNGYPTGSVATYADGLAMQGAIYALALHPTLPVLYMSGTSAGIAVYALDSNGNPTGTPTLYDTGAGDDLGLSVSTNGNYLYQGTYPDSLWVTSLNSAGIPSTTLTTNYIFSNPQVGTLANYLQFVAGKSALYTVRPSLTSGGPSFLAAWPLNPSTGQPVGSALAYPTINPAFIGLDTGNNGALTIGVDNTNSRLWIANPLTAFDPINSDVFTYGIKPTSYTITSSGTVTTNSATAAAVVPYVQNGAVCVPSANGGVPLFFNAPSYSAPGNFVSGYQYRITVTTNNTAPTSLFASPGATLYGGTAPAYIQVGEHNFGPYTWGNGANSTFTLGQASDWVNADSLLENWNWQVPISIIGPTGLTSFQVRLDLANSAGQILKSVTETASGDQVGFMLPGYEMALAALTTNSITTNSVTGLETFTQHSQDYLNAANVDPVAAANRPAHIITDIGSILGGESSTAYLTNLAKTAETLGFNTSCTYEFIYGNGLTTNAIFSILSSNGLANQMDATAIPGEGNGYSGTYFNFDSLDGMTTNNLDFWATNTIIAGLEDLNGSATSNIVMWHMTDEPGWDYPGTGDAEFGPIAMILDTVGHPGYLTAFQTYLQNQPGLTLSMFGASSWSQVLPVLQGVGNPNLNPGATTTNSVSYYWTVRYCEDSANAGNAWAASVLRQYTTNSMPVTVNWNNWTDWWYQGQPTITDTNSAGGGMDWMAAGRTNAFTLWTEDWFEDNMANTWSTYAAVMRSSAMLGGTGTNFGGYVVGHTVGQMADGAKYKVFSLLGNGAKSYTGYTFGPTWMFSDGWSEEAPTLNPWTSNSTYSEYADANRLIGESESIIYPAAPEHSKVAILMPDISAIYDTNDASTPYYRVEFQGLQYALSHGFNMPVDFVDDIDVANGILNTNSYYALYVTGPNVSAAAQTAISSWITSYGTHNRQLVLEPGAGTANEYDTATTNFDSLAGVTAGSRAVLRQDANAFAQTSQDPYTATIQDTNTSDSYFFNAQTMNIAGPFQALSPASNFSSTFWVDQAYTTTTPASQPATITKQTTSSGISNYVTTFGYYPGYQYVATANMTYTNQLPQGWGVMARESAIMPVVRLVLATTNPLVPTVQLSNTKGPTGLTLTTTNNYLTTTPVEALRLNVGSATAPTNLAVVLLNWSGAPVTNLKFTINNGIKSPSSFTLASGATLSNKTDSTTTDSATMTLTDVDVVLIK